MIRRRWATIWLLLALSGCQIDRTMPHPGDHVWQRTELYFGRDTNQGGQVSDREWADFVDQEITPRFPEGSTLMTAQGQWTGPDGKRVHEESRVLILLHANDSATDKKIQELRSIYAKRYHQDAVMRVDATARVSF